MNAPHRSTDTHRLVPHSGIQFLTYGFHLEGSPKFSKGFIGHKLVDQVAPDGSVPMELLTAWNDDDPEAEPEHPASSEDDEYQISKEKAVETFLDKWVPLPVLKVRPGFDDKGREILEAGPIDWVRLRISKADPGTTLDGRPITHHVVLAFDTEIVEDNQHLYAAPTPENVKNEQEFALASRFADITRFLSSGEWSDTSGKGKVLPWIERWLFEIYADARQRQTGRPLREEDTKTVEHLARYVALVLLIGTVVPFPRIRLADTYSDRMRIKPVTVDLVLDIGNSRTCGILIESYPNETKATFANTLVLTLRNLHEPHKVYREPFESHVEFARANFGSERLSKLVRTKPAFFWPSPVRIGPEAARIRELAEGSEATTGMSSPKRYLCDLAMTNQEWRFQATDYDSDQNAPLVGRRLFQFVNAQGDVKRQAAEEEKLYKTLADYVGLTSDMSVPSALTFSRSSMFTFMLAEIIAQALAMINNPQVRSQRRERDAPRKLRRIVLSLPTAMPIQEQRIMRSRAHAAVKLVWDLMGWTASPPPNLTPPEVRVSWDEATCIQMVYLYNEIVEKFGGNVVQFFDLLGKPREFLDPENPADTPARSEPQRSLRVASVDVGGGTTDLMITTYHIEGDHALVPIQNFREGFRIAGDEVLREVIQQTILPALEEFLKEAGVSSPREFLNDRFGGNKANMPIQEQHLRRQFVNRILQPAGLGVMRAAEQATYETEDGIEATTLGALLGRAPGADHAIPKHIKNYIEDEARRWGASVFSLEDCPIRIDMRRFRTAVNLALGDVFDNIAEAVNHLDCDVVLLSGRPTRLPATIDLFTNKLAVSPDRLIPMSRYQVGEWYPFASRVGFRIDDPKTATAVGCLLCVLVERQITNFTVFTARFNMRSTAKYIGALQTGGKLDAEKVFFAWSDDPQMVNQEEAMIQYFAPMRLGYRQLPIDRWNAAPLYRLKLSAGTSKERIQLPLSVVLARKPVSEIASVEDLKLAEKEAQKEELQIRDAFNRDGGGGGLKRLFSLTLDTLPSEEGYWLDTGILKVG